MSETLEEQIARAQAEGADVVVTDDGIERLPKAEGTSDVDVPEPELVEIVGDDLRTRPVPADESGPGEIGAGAVDAEHPDAARFGAGADTDHGVQPDTGSGHELAPDDDFSGGASSEAVDRGDDAPDHDPLDIVTAIKEAFGFDVHADESAMDAAPEAAAAAAEVGVLAPDETAASPALDPSGERPDALGDCEPDIA